MADENEILATNLDFDAITQDLLDSAKSMPEFADYDYEGSAIKLLAKMLARNTYYHAIYANMAVNEEYLSTTQLIGNARLRAMDYGYLPKSVSSATAKIALRYNPTGNPNTLIIPKYTKFKASKDGVDYYFVTLEENVVTNDNGVYYKEITVHEGVIVTSSYSHTNEKENIYTLYNDSVDIDKLIVSVKPNAQSTVSNLYDRANKITEVASFSNVYYMQCNSDGKYQFYFGDGILGKKLEIGNVINVTQLISSGADGNGITSFSAVGNNAFDSVSGLSFSPTSIVTSNASESGDNGDDIRNIKFNAPNYFERQDRLVTPFDYRSFIKDNFHDIQSVIAWGGDDNIPPQYGKMIVSAKPKSGYALSNIRKDQILSAMEGLKIPAIEPVIIDPTFIFVNPSIKVNYNPDRTTLDADSLYMKVAATVKDFEFKTLNDFGNSFYLSRFLTDIDASDPSIVSSEVVSIWLEKRFKPIINSRMTYEINFSHELYYPYNGYLGTLKSSGFTISGESKTLYFDDDGFGNVRFYYIDGLDNKITYKNNVGHVDYNTGKIKFENIIFTSYEGDEIRVMCQSAEKNIKPEFNQIVLLSFPAITMYNINSKSYSKNGVANVIGNKSPYTVNGVLTTVVA